MNKTEEKFVMKCLTEHNVLIKYGWEGTVYLRFVFFLFIYFY